MTDVLHPDDATLMALASGAAAAPEHVAHVQGCPACRADVDAFRAACASVPAAPSAFEAARAERELLRALDREHVSGRRAWRPAAVAAAVLLSATAGAVGASFVLPRAAAPATAVSAPPAPAQPRAPSVVHAAPGSALAVAPPAPAPAPSLLTPALPSLRPAARVRAPSPVPASPNAAPVDEARRLLATVVGGGADADALTSLSLLLDAHPEIVDGLDAELRDSGLALALRVRCERGLLTRRDRGTVEACRTFAQRFPADPAARLLSYAAGRVAEDEVGDLALAEEEYSRALLFSPFPGAPSTDALWARARVRAARGALDEARADLRLYLSQTPSAQSDDDVRRLADALGLEP